jgi:hypothetical protein
MARTGLRPGAEAEGFLRATPKLSDPRCRMYPVSPDKT